MKMMMGVWDGWASLGACLALLAMLGTAEAEPLYVQRAEAAQPTAEALAKAEKQVREHRDITLKEDLKVPPFHKRVENPVKQGEAFCQGCHLPLPHTQQLRTRDFLNMHSRYLACETCHFRPKDARFDYRWLDYASWLPAPHAQRFRTGTQTDNAKPLEGNTKVAPFQSGEPAIAQPRSPFADKVAREWKDSDLAGKAKLKARLHMPLEKEGPDCAACHVERQPMLDLQALGAPPEQARAIERHVIPQFFARYREEDERLKIIDILR